MRVLSVSSMRTRPATSLIGATPLGVRASNNSTTRGRPCVMSSPATPPVWKVRIVSWVPGSPIDWAAMMPMASPTSTKLPVAIDLPKHIAQVPTLLSQVRTVRARTDSTPNATNSSSLGVVSSSPAGAITLPPTSTSCESTRDATEVSRLSSGTNLPSMSPAMGISVPRSVPQSTSRTMTSCDTSTRRRVK